MEAKTQGGRSSARSGGLQEMAPGFLLLDVMDRGVPGYAGLWVVEGRQGYILVESGSGAALPIVLSALSAAGIPPERIEWILPTHVHLDHAGSAGALLLHLPNARIGIHPRGVRHLVNPERLLSQARAVWGSDFDLLGPMVPAPPERVVALADGDVIELDGLRRLRVLHTPGHAPHHASYFEESTRGLFPGDALGALFGPDGPFGEFFTMPGIAPPRGDLPAYIRSVRRLAQLGPQRLYATHYGLWDPALPHINAAAGQVAILWDLCREVHRDGGALRDAKAQATEMLAGARRNQVGDVEFHKDAALVTEAAWNYVAGD